MALIPYDPFSEINQFRRNMNRVFSESFPHFFENFETMNTPRLDIHETANEVIVTCDLPGLEKKEDVDIHLDRNVLTISGTIQRSKEVKEEEMHRRERFVGRFHRAVALPANVKEEEVSATYKNGVLEIRIPKQTENNKKKIDIQFH
ncbi:MAG: Hsp20/alpha crystallin family protein [Bacillaceae bacterium]|jgi:Molecular chaperone (small heat shock protein)|uniref:Heat-shock protein Hsp20 n=2 Tax=Aeribacillus TaxID=1055323 RepID=A0A165YFC0_9BACI|nr:MULTISPECIES: Hsp20/alpha crystallin family protein [Aeribacillus]REJ16112.1 MAG: Hsp20/alpha crystallin family protein [Bacillaceae bacterium]KZM53718.1 heat-shock protein Hsp20 [Aeribacillus pallidus]KZN97016.1 heat-shock protein Hsp20 [Aeribacillus pallidus]MDR9796665.1 Hsp20/alpha crystallin family protein [Aeribacillus pallidus]MED0650331.1 Hsp20/alpha crystallin family protein [Aeribacillus composti]